jgi:hypothetical protein
MSKEETRNLPDPAPKRFGKPVPPASTGASFTEPKPKESRDYLDMPEAEVVHTPFEPEAPDIMAWRAEQIRRLVAEKAKRGIEGLRLYEPLPTQHRFHVSRSQQRVIRGSNRSGKSLAAAVEVARAVTGQDPHNKWPMTNGRFYIVGKDGKEVSGVMWRKLSRAEAFKMIRDKVTHEWRAFRPMDPEDVDRIAEAKWAPPLIPRRFIKSIAWENKKENLPSVVVLQNGWELNFFSSLGKPPHGVDIDGVWFDEEIIDPEWYPEMLARIVDRRGKFIWSATPQAGTEQLYALHERADDYVANNDPNPQVQEFVSLLADNPHISDQAKKEFAASLSERDYDIRIGGDFAIVSFKIYPEYGQDSHRVPWFEVPADWTRYAVVDPGRQVCAVLFAAVQPPELGGHIYLYDELYIRNCNAEMFGSEMRQKTLGQNFHAFLIDHQGSRVHEMGGGLTVEMQYASALKRHKVKSLTTGYNFVWGNTDRKAGVEAVRTLLTTRVSDRQYKMLILGDKCPNLDWEFRHFRYKKNKQGITDDPEERGRVHLMSCIRYLALHSPRYVKPPTSNGKPGGAVAALKEKRNRRKEMFGGSTISLGSAKRN